MRIFLFFLVIAVFVIPSCWASEKADSPVFIINSALLESHKSQGLVDTKLMIIAAFEALGLTVEFRYRPDKRSIYEANTGMVDGEFARVSTIADSFPNLIVVPEPLAQSNLVEFSLASKGVAIFSNQHRRIGYIKGWNFLEQLLADNPDMIGISHHNKLFKLLFHDRYDTVIYTKEAGLKILKELQRDNQTIVSEAVYSYPVYFVLHDQHAELAPQLAEQFKRLKEGVVNTNSDN